MSEPRGFMLMAKYLYFQLLVLYPWSNHLTLLLSISFVFEKIQIICKELIGMCVLVQIT
jgi:hypothetical protein